MKDNNMLLIKPSEAHQKLYKTLIDAITTVAREDNALDLQDIVVVVASVLGYIAAGDPEHSAQLKEMAILNINNAMLDASIKNVGKQ